VDGYNTQDGQFFIQVLTDPVGLDEIVEAGFMMYPNPAKDAIILSSDIINGAVVIALFDMNGRQVISETKNITKGEKTIVSLDGINPGVYMVRMTGSEGSSIRRLMVE
jgi:hypothetical protein